MLSSVHSTHPTALVCGKAFLVCAFLASRIFGHAQTAVPYIDSNDHFGVFQNGSFTELTARPPLAVFPNAERLGYVTAEGDLMLWGQDAVRTLARGWTTDTALLKGAIGAGRGPFAWKKDGTLFVAMEQGPWPLTAQVAEVSVQDSLVVFRDLEDGTLNVFWRGRSVQVAQVSRGSDAAQWTAGSNTLVFHDHAMRTVHIVYRGVSELLCDSADYVRLATGGDVVGYWDDGEDTFMIFDRGERVSVEPFAPLSFKAGDGVVAWVSAAGAFRCYLDRKVIAISPTIPTEYFVQDSTITWVANGEWRTLHGGMVETIERYVPEEWQVSGTMIAYKDLNRELRIFRSGERIVVSREPGIKHFQLVGDAVVWQSATGTVNVWWQGERYERY